MPSNESERASASKYGPDVSVGHLGYTLEADLADIVDNAITAQAKQVRILADTAGSSPRLAVLDDSEGMRPDELIEAMRLGNRSPLEERQPTDLGLFGPRT